MDSALFSKIEARFARRNSKSGRDLTARRRNPRQRASFESVQGFARSASPVSFQNSWKGFVNHFSSDFLKAFEWGRSSAGDPR
jgi:hypothetical protein